MDNPHESSHESHVPDHGQQPHHAPATHNMIAVLAYFGILLIIPWLVAKNDPFVKFHIKQGLALLVIGVAYWILNFIFLAMDLSFLTLFLYPLVGLGLLILSVMGIVHVIQGKEKPLPVISSLANKFNF